MEILTIIQVLRARMLRCLQALSVQLLLLRQRVDSRAHSCSISRFGLLRYTCAQALHACTCDALPSGFTALHERVGAVRAHGSGSALL